MSSIFPSVDCDSWKRFGNSLLRISIVWFGWSERGTSVSVCMCNLYRPVAEFPMRSKECLRTHHWSRYFESHFIRKRWVFESHAICAQTPQMTTAIKLATELAEKEWLGMVFLLTLKKPKHSGAWKRTRRALETIEPRVLKTNTKIRLSWTTLRFDVQFVFKVENYNCLEIRCPVMFVIGSHSSSCSAEFIEVILQHVDLRNASV